VIIARREPSVLARPARTAILQAFQSSLHGLRRYRPSAVGCVGTFIASSLGPTPGQIEGGGLGECPYQVLTLYSCRTTVKRDGLILILPLYSMKPSFLNLFMNRFTRERVVPIISASIS
jgi:hypothetical protein